MEADDADFGPRVRKTRERAGLTQSVVAGLARISPTFLCRIENGQAEPSRRIAVALYAALARPLPDLSLVWFLTGSGDQHSGRVETGVNPSRRRFMKKTAAGMLSVALVPPATLDIERLGAPARLDAVLLDNWEALTRNFAALRPLQPPRELLPLLAGHFGNLEARIADRSGPEQLRRRLLSLGAGTAALCAWVCLTAERREDARAYLDRGESIAREVGDHEALALLLMLRADLLSAVPTGGQAGFPVLTRRCLDEAIGLTSQSTPAVLRSPLLLRAAEEHAYVGLEATAKDLLDRGSEAADTASAGEHYLRPVWTKSAVVDSFRGSCLQLLGRHREAIETLTPLVESRFPSHRPLLLADLAAAHAQAGNLDAACELLRVSADVSAEHGHRSAVRRIVGVRHRHLQRWDGEPKLRELDEHIAAIL